MKGYTDEISHLANEVLLILVALRDEYRAARHDGLASTGQHLTIVKFDLNLKKPYMLTIVEDVVDRDRGYMLESGLHSAWILEP